MSKFSKAKPKTVLTSSDSDQVTIQSLASRLDMELTKLDTNLSVGEQLLAMNNGQSDPQRKQPRETSPFISISKEYLAKIQEEIHSYHRRLIILSSDYETHTKSQTNDNNNNNENNKSKTIYNQINQLINTANSHMSRVKDLFGDINTEYIKKITPNSQQLIDQFEIRHGMKTSKEKKLQLSNSNGKILKKGKLIKEGHVRKNWNQRLFILTSDGYLRYYIPETHVLKNEIDLSKATFVNVEAEHSRFKRPFVFTVKVPNREFVFAAKDKRDRSSWISEINKAMLLNSDNSIPSLRDVRSRSMRGEEILYTLSKLEWNQLQDSEILADLQEQLEDIADLQLVKGNKVRIIAVSDSWNERSVDLEEVLQKIKTFFDTAHGNVVMQGKLLKKMEWRNWKERFCVLRDDMKLDYYLTPRTDKKRGTVTLHNLIGIRQVFVGQYDVVNDEPRFVFEIHNTDRKVRFAAMNKEELKKWMKNIQENCKYMKNVNRNKKGAVEDEIYIERRRKKVKKDMIDPVII